MNETNRYAEQCLTTNVHPKARIQKWIATNDEEIEKLLGIVLWMGLCSYPSITSYWQKKKIYTNHISNLMPRNRFQLLLKCLHFGNNEEVTDDRLHKLTPLLEKLRESFQQPIIPSEYLCIDETLVPFRGRLRFRQYISNKRHKFGIKLFKLCLKDGYTYNFQVYCGKSKDLNVSVPSKIVMELMGNLLDKGRTLCTDNYYTSVSLAVSLLRRNTHLIGTLRSNRKFNPRSVIEKKLKVGEAIAEECSQGVIVQKWRDKRDVLILSTKHANEMVTVRRRGTEIQKPRNIVEYNKYKSYIDISDQLKAYNTCLRRSLKWYRKLAFELLTGTAVVNAHILYKEITQNKISITEFRELVIEGLFKTEMAEEGAVETEKENHRLLDLGRSNRRRCINCYKKNSAKMGSVLASKKTSQSKLKCNICENNFCLECFFDVHKCSKI